jgi:hypothetical protein
MATKKNVILAHALEAECKKAGLNPRKVDEIARELGRLGKKAQRMGLKVFGGSGNGTLRYAEDTGRPLIVADIQGGNFDGGDGACHPDDEGLMRGE